jgi:hypothetical protein
MNDRYNTNNVNNIKKSTEKMIRVVERSFVPDIDKLRA